ncbi:uncharacterized protein H6S33_000640 [Morchella sextelata]|uniref:uncharacterized protein n=1 Tax=Morchella sextelata TaxID=1174677 RepID=UPI001D0394A5|nr:uncharacterized protein H6S33_000640 [Morchella sextelata]KAH0615004.1 hypothetical protein H6S33_000640 [Morchella sextelata]
MSSRSTSTLPRVPGDITYLPVKGKSLDLITEEQLFERTELGMIFAKPPYSELTSEHGFQAVLETPFVPLPGVEFSGPAVQSHDQDNEVFNYLRFKHLKESREKNVDGELRNVRCLLDWSTDVSIALESAVGNNPGTMESIEIGVLTLGEFLLDEKKLFVGVQIIKLHIHGRPYIQTVKVVKELFPGHQDINIDIVLGKDFLDACPGLALQPVLSGGSLEFVPWDHRGQEINPYKSSFTVNELGELLVYVCGRSEKETSNPHARAVEDPGVFLEERGAYGVFFGPNSPWNMSLISTIRGTPVNDTALIEGVIAVSDLLIDGGFIFGNPTFSSVRVFTDSSLVVELLNSDTKIEEYEKKGWKNKAGVQLGIAEPVSKWAHSIRDRYKSVCHIPWVKKDLFIFERIDKKRKGLQAARHLASSGLKAELYLCDKDLGDVRNSNRDIAGWEELRSSDFLYMIAPRVTCGTFMIKQKITDFVDSRIQANAKVPQEDVEAHPKPHSIQKFFASYFRPEDSYDFDSIIFNLTAYRKFNAMKILEALDSSFTKEVVRIAKEKRRLPDSLEFFKEDDGKIHFFHRDPDVFSRKPYQEKLKDIKESPLTRGTYRGHKL